MSENPSGLTRDQILAALEKLDQYFHDHGVKGEICIYGGAAMVLAFNARISTRDVDAVFCPISVFREGSNVVSDSLGLPESWLNDGIKGFLSSHAEHTNEHMIQYQNLRVIRPTAQYLLAMKCLAARQAGYDTDGDRRDIAFLISHLNLKSKQEVLKIVERYYPPERILPKTQFMLVEIFQELHNGLSPGYGCIK
jgi:hypothetical protein